MVTVAVDGWPKEHGDDDTRLVDIVSDVEGFLRETGRTSLFVSIPPRPETLKGPPA